MSVRNLALEILDDEHGIKQDAWPLLYELLEKEDPNVAEEIAAAVEGNEGRIYLPEGFELE